MSIPVSAMYHLVAGFTTSPPSLGSRHWKIEAEGFNSEGVCDAGVGTGVAAAGTDDVKGRDVHLGVASAGAANGVIAAGAGALTGGTVGGAGAVAISAGA